MPFHLGSLPLVCLLLISSVAAIAQVNVLTAHNDIARTGQNVNETTLTPANVNPTQFGKLFSTTVTGNVLAQPLYVSRGGVTGLPNHNIVYVATTSDSVYAYDADSNGGANIKPLWQVSLLTNSTAAGVLTNSSGVWGTPVIDLASQAIYVASSEDKGGTSIYRFHALNLATGAEMFGGPIQIQASVPGTGSGSVGGTLTFNPTYQQQRPGLLYLNGVVYVAFGSSNDEGPWHGWIFSYSVNANSKKLQQNGVYCTTPNGAGGGIWMGGAGLAGEVNNAAKPYGRMFFSMGNGSFNVTQPYSTNMSYGMSVVDLDLTGGAMTVEDEFTPYNQAALDGQDGDLGAGGIVLLPTQTLASGKTLKPLIEIGKSGMFYVLDRDNNNDGSNNANTEYSPAGLGGFNASSDQVVQEVQTPITQGFNWGAGVWGDEAYWNGRIYSGGTNVASAATYSGSGNSLTSYSFVNGVLSNTPGSQSAEQYYYPGPTPSVSANGATNGIVWALMTYPQATLGPETLLAYNALNMGATLYSSATNQTRDNPGVALKYVVPTIANGKVYVGAGGQLSIYGLLNSVTTTPKPVINPGTSTFKTAVNVTITDSVAGATIYYTTDGTTPTSNSPVYQGPISVNTNETITAFASAPNQLVSGMATASYQSAYTPANPVFSLAAGTYTGTQTLTITDNTAGAVIYYTVDGPPPTSASAVYTQPLTISASETVQAVAIAPGPYPSAIVSNSYVIQGAGTISFTQGFTLAQGPMKFNGTTDLDDFRLQLTNGGVNEAGSAFYATPVNIQQFSTQFTFQMSNPEADGMTFTIQNNSPTALGLNGGSLGYQGIQNSIAIKFDLYSNQGEGPDSTGLYINGVLPTLPSIDLSATPINFHSGDYIDASITYNGTTLNLTLVDAVTQGTWSHAFTVNIPAIVGGNTAYVGFTAGTGGLSASQKVTYWVYSPGPPLPVFTSGFTPGSMTLNGGAAYNGTRLRLTDGNANEARSAFFSTPVNVQEFTSSFDFQITAPNADGFTFTIQPNATTTLGAGGGGLGYSNIPQSVAVKFDIYSNGGEGPDSTGLYLNGAVPTVPSVNLSNTGINLHSGDIFNALLTYNGSTLTVVITDTATGATATQTYSVNIPATVGGNTAFVGFTAGSGGGTAIQEILNFTYSPRPLTGPVFANGFAPPPNTTAQAAALLPKLTFNGGAAVNGTRLRLTDGNANEARSAFYANQVNVQRFNTSFDFQLTNPVGDGFTFAIQGGAPTAVGTVGGGLGYATMPTSVAVKFDLYSNLGEGPDSTGIYLNGALPCTPFVNLSNTGINLHSGDIFNAQLTYNGTVLTVVITDTVTNAIATQNYTVNIPAAVGGNTAYVGFTGGSGGATAIQEIVNWSYYAAASE